MEIAPIPGIRALPSSKEAQPDFALQEVFDIEGSARPGDDRGRRNGRKAAGAEENEQDDLMLDAESDPEGEGSTGNVNFFA